MPSIFTRARTTSSKNIPKLPLSLDPHASSAIDEFGRVTSRGPPPTPSKDRRAQTTSDKRRITNSSATNLAEFDQATELEDGFLPTSLAPPSTPTEQHEHVYGYLGHEAHVVLAVEDAERLVGIVAEELIQRGLTTPFLFSNTALDLSAHAIRRLITAFLRAPDFREEARFAGPHALGALLRWGLARPVRIANGIEQRGLISWETYLRWRHLEHANNFSKTEFSAFVDLLQPPLRSLMLTLHSLLARLLANSTSSGLTPPRLASLFGPLLFGLPTTSFHATYAAYLRSAHAGEHLLLSFVRLQVAQTAPSAPPPRRLLSWVKGYPAMLAPVDSFEHPRLGAKTRRVASVRRNVRLYSGDLVRTCAGWARGPEGADMRSSKEWTRIAPEKNRSGDRLEPRYSDAYRKKLDLPPGFHPQTSAHTQPSSSSLSTPSISSASSTGTASSSTMSSLFEDPAEEARFRSLTDMRWGEFSLFGFGDGNAAPSALQFDLTEGARSQRAAKRSTLTWADFSSAGFSRSDASLSQTLQFAPPLAQSVQQWPAQEKDIHRKLKKNVQKALPAFGWDTAPVMDGREDVVEEGFLDVFCDLLYGGGWMDRTETTFRECNWALVEFRSLPTSRADAAAAAAAPSLSLSTNTDLNVPQDPRTTTTLLLFEEFVPTEYRDALLSQGNKPSRRLPGLASLLSSSKKNQKQWRPAATLNGKPYVVGTVPRSPSAREAEFERLLAGGAGSMTKLITLDSAGGNSRGGLRVQTPVQGEPQAKRLISSPLFSVGGGGSSSNLAVSPRSTATSPAAPLPPSKSVDLPSLARTSSPFSTSSIKKSRFRFPVGRDNRQGIIPSEYDTIDFDTRLASYSDDELNNSSGAESGRNAGPAGAGRPNTKERRLSKDDAWVDILVASSGKRLTGQDAEIRPRGVSNASKMLGAGTAGLGGGSGGRSDPELASKEVAQALAAVRQHLPTDDEGDMAIRRELGKQVEVREPTLGMLQHGNRNGNGNGNDVYLQAGEEEEEEPRRDLPKRRLGYFDLHPDRRPVDTQSSELAIGLDPSNRSTTSAYSDTGRETLYSEGDFEPTTASIELKSDGDIEVPAFVDASPVARRRYDPAKPESMTLPLPPPPPLRIDTTTANTQTTSKTAKLIEMYRERERLADVSPGRDRDVVPTAAAPIPTTAPLQLQPRGSRLPVRTSSLPKEDDLAAVPAPAAAPRVITPEPEPELEDISSVDPTSTLVGGELGRSSPMRYVHGAPLHNVLEEGEEEE